MESEICDSSINNDSGKAKFEVNSLDSDNSEDEWETLDSDDGSSVDTASDEEDEANYETYTFPPLWDASVNKLLPPLSPELEDGPLSLPYPDNMSQKVVQKAHENWGKVFYWLKWRDSETLEYVRFAICLAHENKAIKSVALRLISRMEDSKNHKSGRTPDDVFELIREVALTFSLKLMPVLDAYCASNNLRTILGAISAPVYSDGLEEEGRRLSQKYYLAFMRPEFEAIITKEMNRACQWDPYEMGLRAMLVITANFLQDSHYDFQTKCIGAEGHCVYITGAGQNFC
jgi:hypothetical protein